MTSTCVTDTTAVLSAAESLLDAYAAEAESARQPVDPGTAVLATLVTGGKRPAADSAAARAMMAWLRGFSLPVHHPGLAGGGATGRMFGLMIAAATWPRLEKPLAAQRDLLLAYVADPDWRYELIGWQDYDLVVGPSGVLLAFAADPGLDAAVRAPLVDRIVRLCRDRDLSGLRVGRYRGDKRLDWNVGRINLGMAHGLPGVMTALRAAAETDGLGEEQAEVLRRLAARLVAESYVDDRGVITWPFGTVRMDGHRASTGDGRRQAWCYGAPGNAWALWETARLLGDEEMAAYAVASARSFLAAYDDDLYLDGLGLCHGAAGLMLVFDAFARYAGLPEAATLADHLADHLMGSLDEPGALAASGWSLLQGAPGVLSALLTRGGGDRRWLTALALR